MTPSQAARAAADVTTPDDLRRDLAAAHAEIAAAPSRARRVARRLQRCASGTLGVA
jgi:hypothetical protein